MGKIMPSIKLELSGQGQGDLVDLLFTVKRTFLVLLLRNWIHLSPCGKKEKTTAWHNALSSELIVS